MLTLAELELLQTQFKNALASPSDKPMLDASFTPETIESALAAVTAMHNAQNSEHFKRYFPNSQRRQTLPGTGAITRKGLINELSLYREIIKEAIKNEHEELAKTHTDYESKNITRSAPARKEFRDAANTAISAFEKAIAILSI